LRGSGPAGGGTEEGGVPFGSGTLDTGWGPGKGGGFGSGSGGPGGRGLGGPGKGGLGGGEGEGTGGGERKVAGGDAPKPGQGLTGEQIRRVVMSRTGAFQACYELALAKDPTAHGGVTVAFSVTPGGSVASASIASSSLGNPRVEGCMLRTFNRLKFPTADKPTSAAFPFKFKR
jgi:TonB family protein